MKKVRAQEELWRRQRLAEEGRGRTQVVRTGDEGKEGEVGVRLR